MNLVSLTHRACFGLALAAFVCIGAPALAQPAPPPVRPIGHISFFANTSEIRPTAGSAVVASDFVTSIRYLLPDAEGDGLEYGLDMRHAGYTDTRRPARVTIYDGYAGARLADGRVRVRAGQIWLTDLGGLGAFTGAVVEYKQPLPVSRLGRFRLAGFAGREPKSYELGNVAGIRKAGGYGILEGTGGRRHVAGYVRVTHGGLVERSVITASNFVPVRSRVFLYQVAEYDLSGPAGVGSGGLTYLMINGHASPSDRVDVQGLYHRGRSIDARTITDDVLAGRPLRDGALDALLFASAGTRVTVHVARGLRVNAGYTRDRTNRDSADTGRVTVGLSDTNVAGSGVDITVTESRLQRPTGTYHSRYVSAGRQIGRLVYLSGDYSSSASVVRLTQGDQVTIEARPTTTQFGLSGVVTTGRHVSLSATAELTRDDSAQDIRVLAGLTYRFR